MLALTLLAGCAPTQPAAPDDAASSPTLLLLTAGAQLQLDAPPGDDFNAAALQSLRGFAGQQPGDGRILYVPS